MCDVWWCHREEWEKVNITDNENGTLSFHYRRAYTFQPEMSAGPDDDAVVVPNIPMLVSSMILFREELAWSVR
jgi:scavenger receptor class B, member 1